MSPQWIFRIFFFFSKKPLILRNQQLAHNSLFSSFIIHFGLKKKCWALQFCHLEKVRLNGLACACKERIGHSTHAEVLRPSKRVAQPRLVTKCLWLIPNELNQQEKQNKTETGWQLFVYGVSRVRKESPNRVITHWLETGRSAVVQDLTNRQR